ncbi:MULTISPECIES: hypothetical protein [Pectobacterium]|uniref:Uncharacterized protein n=1 Tax=Pectobacterium versatile TaxID=2488639 RepID=A0AAW3RTB2_9GAMM|nr:MULTISPECIES: hypothetical protein [Pectobacterium]MBA0160303.1 hypothetical protein [Pectobacterium versatile]POE18514.1 hypothetical protein BV923_21040 [Pectobacterium odoriferum]
MNEKLKLLSKCVDKYYDKDLSMSYFIGINEYVYKSGFKNGIGFSINMNSRNINNESKILKAAIKLKRNFNIDYIYFEIKNGKLLCGSFFLGKPIRNHEIYLSEFTERYILKKINQISAHEDNCFFINEFVSFLILHEENTTMNILPFVQERVSDDIYYMIISKYIKRLCDEKEFHNSTNVGYFEYLMGVH